MATISLSLVALLAVCPLWYYRGAGLDRLCYCRDSSDHCWTSLLYINTQPTWYDLTVISINVLVVLASSTAACAIKYNKKKLIYIAGGVILSMSACQIVLSVVLGRLFLSNNQAFPVTEEVSSEVLSQLFESFKYVQSNTASIDTDAAWEDLKGWPSLLWRYRCRKLWSVGPTKALPMHIIILSEL